MRKHVIDRLEREDTSPAADRDWAIVCERAGYKCEYCGKDMLASLDDYLSKQVDHIIPRAAGGSDTVDNYALSCSVCNGLKGEWNPACRDASREDLIQAVRRHLIEKRVKKYEEFLRYREIVDYPVSHQDCSCCE